MDTVTQNGALLRPIPVILALKLVVFGGKIAIMLNQTSPAFVENPSILKSRFSSPVQ